MRNRVDTLLKVLNRANPEADSVDKAVGMKNVAVSIYVFPSFFKFK